MVRADWSSFTPDHSVDKIDPGPLDSLRAFELCLVHPVDDDLDHGLWSLHQCPLLMLGRIDHVAFKSLPTAYVAGSRLLRPAHGDLQQTHDDAEEVV